MSDYISRADAIEMAVDVETPQGTYERAIYVDDLMALPSADAVQGEWVRKYDDKINCYWYECDQCGEYRPSVTAARSVKALKENMTHDGMQNMTMTRHIQGT